MQSSVEGLSPLEEEVRTGRDTTQLGCAPQHGTLPLHRTFLSPVKRKVSWEEPARAEHVLGRRSLVGCDARPLSPMSYARRTCPHGSGARGWCGRPHPPPLQPWPPPSTRTGRAGEASPGPREGPHAGPVSRSTWRNGLQVARTLHHTHTCALTWAVLGASWEDRGLLRARGQDSQLTLQWRPLQHPDVPHVRTYTCFCKAASSGRTLHLLCADLFLKGQPPRPPSPARRPSPTDVGAGPVTHEGTLLEEPGAAAILSLSFDLCHPRTYQCVARQILGVCAQVRRWERAAAHLRGIPSPLTSSLPTWQGAAPARTSLHLWPRSPCHPHGL